jgi:hypothetical protein
MTRVQALVCEIEELFPSELAAFRKWFEEYDSAEGDKRIERDAMAGKPDKLAEKALADQKAGRVKEL